MPNRNPKQIAFLALTPLGDSILTMAELEELHRIYDPCEITVFGIPLIAELFKHFKYCEHVVVLNGGIHGKVTLEKVPDTVYDAVFNHGYEPWWTDIVRQLHHRMAYGMEELYRTAKECDEVFDQWVSLDYWKSVTARKYRYASQQMAEVIRLVSPEFVGNTVHLSRDNYQVVNPADMPRQRYVLFLPGTSGAFKHYPTTKVLALAEASREMGFEAVFAIGPQDGALGAELHGKGHKVFVSLPFPELAGLICGASLVVGNDSGPMHFAAAFDRPSIHLFSFSGANTWFSYSPDRHKVLMPHCGRRDGLDCHGCTRTCIGKIRVRDVVETMAGLLEQAMPRFRQVAYFAQDNIGDVLAWMNQLEMVTTHYAPCEITVFCPKPETKHLLDGYAFADCVVVYNPEKPWTSQEAASFGYFEAVFNTRYDADSLERVKTLGHGKAYGIETVEIPEETCKSHYEAYLPLSLWYDSQLRRATSVPAQGMELIKLVDPGCRCDFVQLDERTYVHDCSDRSVLSENRVVFVPGTSDRSKQWGADKYIWLAHRLQARGYVPTFVIGPEEPDYVSEIAGNGFVVLNNPDFTTIAAVFSRAQCVIGNDTGLMRFACMLGPPSVSIMPVESQFAQVPYAEDKRAPHLYCAPPEYQSHVHCADLNPKELVEEAVNMTLHDKNRGL